MTEPAALLTVDEAAHRLRISRWKLYDLIRSQQLDSIRIGRARRIPASAVTKLINQLLGGDTLMGKKNANGEGTVTQRKDGRWQGAAYVLTTAGTEKRVFVYGRTREEAWGKLVEKIAQSQRGVPVPEHTWRLGDYLDHWLKHVVKPEVRPTTYAKYENFVRLYLKPGLGRKRLDKLTPADVRLFLSKQEVAGQSLSQRQAMHAVLRNALQHAMRDDLLMRNVAKLVKAPNPGGRDVVPWTAGEARKFLEQAQRHHALYAAFVLVVSLGLRKGEVLGLGWDDIDLESKTLRIRCQIQRVKDENGKGMLVRVPVKTKRSKRMLPLPDVCVRALQDRKDVQRAEREVAGEKWCSPWELIFTTRRGTPWEPRNFNRSFDAVCEKASVRRVRVHDTRHGCSSLLAALGVPPRTIMAILGHSQIAVTMNVYSHVTTEDQREAIDHLDRLLGGGSAA